MTTDNYIALQKKIDGLFFGLHSTNPGDINALKDLFNACLGVIDAEKVASPNNFEVIKKADYLLYDGQLWKNNPGAFAFLKGAEVGELEGTQGVFAAFGDFQYEVDPDTGEIGEVDGADLILAAYNYADKIPTFHPYAI